MYSVDARKSVEKIFSKLARKDYGQLEKVEKKVNEIIKNPHHYRNLRRPLQHLKRVHVAKSFVLVFSVDDNNKKVIIEDYDHHDNIYK
ncbi:MAG: type II toxin-antitoxin system RelE family toxin [Candidatus Nanoarchaeia archaeon]